MASELPHGRESCLELRTTIQRVSTFAGLDFHKFTGDLGTLRVGELAKRLWLGFDPKSASLGCRNSDGECIFAIYTMPRRSDYGWTHPILPLILILAVAQFSPRLPIGEGICSSS
jgi:hypothetical protein